MQNTNGVEQQVNSQVPNTNLNANQTQGIEQINQPNNINIQAQQSNINNLDNNQNINQ